MSASAPLAASGQASRHHDGRGAHSWRLRCEATYYMHSSLASFRSGDEPLRFVSARENAIQFAS